MWVDHQTDKGGLVDKWVEHSMCKCNVSWSGASFVCKYAYCITRVGQIIREKKTIDLDIYEAAAVKRIGGIKTDLSYLVDYVD